MNALPNFSTGFAPVDRGSLYYEIAGSGKPLLLIHAGVADCRMWDNQMQFFAPHFRIIRYDVRGYGRSQTESTEFSNRQDILDLFTHLGVEKAAIIGISRGGQIAIDFALEHPTRVSALVPVAAGISGYDFEAGEDPQAKREFELFSHMDELWEKKSWDELADLEVHVWADGPAQPMGRSSPELRAYLRQVIRASYTRQDGKATPIPLEPLAVNRLGEIRLPTLVLVGEYDSCAALAVADKISCEIPQARLVGVPATAHIIPMEQPDKFNAVVMDFLKEVY